MTKRIFRSIFSVSAVILVISIGLIMGLLYGHFGDQLEKELKQEAVYLAIVVENDGVESLNRLSKTGERVTLIDEDGTVLYDNKADAGTMENHQDREEVQAAQKSGEGYASRTSATLGEKTVYYALRLENGQILRVSSTQYTIVRILGGLIQPILVMIFLMLILSLAAAFHSSRKIVEPLNKLNLDDPKMNDTYDEITPLLTRINKQQKTIREQLSEAKRQQEEFAIITNNMSEGLLVIDKQTEILSCNTSAVKLLGAKKAEEVRTDYVLLAKSKGLNRKKILFGHCLRNVIPTYLSLMAISVPHVLGGTYIIESVFSYPGIGTLSYESARYGDYNLLMVLCIFSGILVIFCNMIAQTINERIDPRIRAEEAMKDTKEDEENA